MFEKMIQGLNETLFVVREINSPHLLEDKFPHILIFPQVGDITKYLKENSQIVRVIILGSVNFYSSLGLMFIKDADYFGVDIGDSFSSLCIDATNPNVEIFAFANRRDITHKDFRMIEKFYTMNVDGLYKVSDEVYRKTLKEYVRRADPKNYYFVHENKKTKDQVRYRNYYQELVDLSDEFIEHIIEQRKECGHYLMINKLYKNDDYLVRYESLRSYFEGDMNLDSYFSHKKYIVASFPSSIPAFGNAYDHQILYTLFFNLYTEYDSEFERNDKQVKDIKVKPLISDKLRKAKSLEDSDFDILFLSQV